MMPASSNTNSSNSLRENVRLGVSKRTDFPLHRSKAALLIVDVQTYCCDVESEYYKNEALPRMLANIERLLHDFRRLRDHNCSPDSTMDAMMDTASPAGCEVIFTAIHSLTNNGRDISLDYKLSGPYFAKLPKVGASMDEIFLPFIRPDLSTGKGDIYIPKTASSVFHSTNIDYVLRNLNIEQLVVVGQVTEQCVESTVRCAADLGYLVSLVQDACATYSEAKHEQGLSGMNGYCRIVTTQQIIDELESDNN